MDSDSMQLPADPTERRRLQNRIAQRRFRQKKQLERSTDRVRNGRPTLSHPAKSNQTPLDSVVPSTFSLAWNSNSDGDGALDLAAIDYLLDSYSPSDPPLNEPLFSSFLAASRSRSSTSDIVTRNIPSPRQTCPRDAEPGPLREFTGAIAVAEDAAHDPPKTEKDSGWLNTIHIASQKGHERILRVLFERGNVDPNITDSDRRTALFHAAVGGHDNIVRLLLSHGANITHLDCDGRSVLHWATHYQRLEVLRTLLERWPEHVLGSYINAHDGHGWTPLHLAVERGFEEGLLLLVQYGGDINVKARKCWLTDRVIPFDLNQLVMQNHGVNSISPNHGVES